MNTPTKAVGFAYDSQTRDWTARAEFTGRNRQEALDWMKFNRDWMKDLHIEEPVKTPQPVVSRTS